MYVARILYPVEVLGPGKRVGIWFSGCPRRCKGCSNPELWEFQKRYKTSVEQIVALISMINQSNVIDGFTITGGDPLFQPDDLQLLINEIKYISDDILVYTGYKKEEVPVEYLNSIAVLIDGEYVEELNDNSFLRGSNNQNIYILNKNFEKKYNSYFSNSHNAIQNFTTSDGIISVGIHKPGFAKETSNE